MLYTDRRAGFIVKVDKRILLGEACAYVEGVRHRFAYYLATVQYVLYSTFISHDGLGHYFRGPYALGVIRERVAYIIVILKAYKLSALPCELLAAYGQRIADLIVCDVYVSVLSQQVAPACVAVSIVDGRRCCAESTRCECVGLLTRYVACVIVSIKPLSYL